MSGSSNDSGRHAKLCSKLKPAFDVLLAAFDYADDAGSDKWEFAVSIRHLHELGLSEIDLRWLVQKGYVEHAREMTLPGDSTRQFRPTGEVTFCKRTCFVLTEEGISKACSVAVDRSLSAANESGSFQDSYQVGRNSVPHWDGETHELRMDGKTVKRFKWPAANQQVVLSAFQEEGWPAHIDDPLPPQPDQDSKRRLSDTIKCLNRKQLHELIHFRGDGTGEGIIWERTRQEGANGKAT